MNRKNNYILVSILISLTLVITGCGSFKYYSTKKAAEKAFVAGKYQKAKKLFALIFKHEKTNTSSPDHARWAYYRLGTIHEILGKVRLARGFYWGDQMKKGFYASTPKIAWFTKFSWDRLDIGELPRSLKEILDFEKKGVPRNIQVAAKKKRKTNSPSTHKAKSYPDTDHKFTRVFDKSMSPPSQSCSEPFKVFH